MNDSPAPQATARRTDAASNAIIRVGIVLFVAGLASIIVSFAAPVFDTHLSSYFYIAAMLCPLGMIVGVVGALLSGRRHQDD
ncbi:MAG: hypothetical protein L0H59_06780 [Tomitella sp.]|nr:hypothetical protein [Tomitella sp.]